MRAYISHTTQNYENVVINLAKSINRYSVYPLIVYTIDYDASDALKDLAICKRLDLDLPQSNAGDFVEYAGNQYVNRGTYRTYMTLSAKIDCMLDATETGIKEWVYLDADCVANTNVDDMFKYTKEVKDYPLASLGPQEYALLVEGDKVIGNPFWKEDGSTDNTNCLEWKLMDFFGMKPEQRTTNYRTTNILVGNAKVAPFLKLWKESKDVFPKLFDTYKALPYHEETLYNVLVWQRGDQHLPMVYINIQGAETVEEFLNNTVDEDVLLGAFYKFPANKNQIKVFHGEKRTEEIEKVFRLLGEKKESLKILFLAPHLSTGGMPAFLLRRIQMLKKWTNHEIFVAEWTLYSGAYTVQRNQILDIIPADHFISLGFLGEDAETHLRGRLRIVNICHQWGIDIVHIDEIPEGFDGFSIFPIEVQRELYSEDKPWRVVETCHNVWFKPNEMKRAEPDAYATIVHEHINNTFKGRGVKTELIQFPTDRPNDDVLPSREKILTEMGFKTVGEYHIVNIGLWTPGKNQTYALKIAQHLYDYYGQTYQFHFIGNQAPNFQEYWQPLMQQVPPNCHIHGERNDSWRFLAMADLMLFTSTWECNPIVLAEANGYGCETMAYNLPQYGDHWADKITHLTGSTSLDAAALINKCAVKQDRKILNGIDGHRFAMQHDKLYTELVKTTPYRKPTTLMLNERYSIEFNNVLKFVNKHETQCDVEFWDQDTGKLMHFHNGLGHNYWCSPAQQYFVNWKVVMKWEDRSIEWVMDLKDKTVYVEIGSSSLGDSLAFVEVVRAWVKEKQIKKCYLMTYKNFLFDWDDYAKDGVFPSQPGSTYPEHDYRFYLGVHIGEPSKSEPAWYPHRNKRDWRAIYLGDVAADGLGYKGNAELRPVLSFVNAETPAENKYIVIATQSTAQSKYWNNPTGWQELVDWHLQNGYEVYLASKEGDGYMGNWYPKGVKKLPEPLDAVANYIKHAEYFIGISSGLSWLAWALDVPVVMISGFTPEVCEFTDKTLRIIDKTVCNSCWEWGHFDKGDWHWCPGHKGTERAYECSKVITSQKVIEQINNWNKK